MNAFSMFLLPIKDRKAKRKKIIEKIKK